MPLTSQPQPVDLVDAVAGDASKPTPAVVARGLTKSFKKKRAVDGVDLTVGARESVSLLGPNGAGKTTTILILLGVTTADSGSVSVLGHPLPAGRVKALSRTGFAAGYLTLPDRLRVVEALEVFADFYAIDDPKSRVEEVLSLLEIGDLASRFSSTLSSGQRTLVGLAKALLPRPKLLVLDEPTASLDPDVALRTRHALIDLREREGFAMLVTSHNMAEVEMLADRVVFMSGGRVVADSDPKTLAERFGQDDLEGVFLEIAAEARR